MCLRWPQGCCQGEPVAVKVYNLQRHGAAAAYENEKLAYHSLQALQGTTVPCLVRTGLLAHTAAPAIVTSFEGVPLPEGTRAHKELHKPMRQALGALHAAGAAHGDVRSSNFLVRGREVRLVDLGQSVLQPSHADKQADLHRLQAMLE